MATNIPYNKIANHCKSGSTLIDQELMDWLNESPDNPVLFNQIQDVWTMTGNLPDNFSPNKEIAWNKIESRITPVSRGFGFVKRAGRIAAVLVGMASCIWMGSKINIPEKVSYSQIMAPKGQKTRLCLPDSSWVWLNGGSTIRYSSNFNKKSREVIISGEGFFDVRKNTQKQFVVRAAGLDVKVFGTSFNVKAYHEDNTVEVGLKSGSVRLDKSNNKLTMLKPGQKAIYNKERGVVSVNRADMSLVSAWTNDELVFDGTPFCDVVKYLERWYGVKIEMEPELVGKHNFTFRVKTETLRELLELIKVMTPIEYEVKGGDVAIYRRDHDTKL